MSLRPKFVNQAISDLKFQQKNMDIETAHIESDDILCKLLIQLGCGDVVEEYKKMEFWYS